MNKSDATKRLAELRNRMKRLDVEFERIYRAYYARTPIEGRVPDYETLKSAAEAFVKANHEYQKARFSRIKIRLAVSKLIR